MAMLPADISAVSAAMSSPGAQTASGGEIWSWLLYDAANGAFFYGVLNFIPLLLLEQGREIAHWYACENTFNAPPEPAVMGWTTQRCIEEGAAGSDLNETNLNETKWCQCLTNTTLGHWDELGMTGKEQAIPAVSMVHFLGLFQIQYPTLWSAATTGSVLLQLIVFLGFSSIGDFGNLRKTLFFGANTLGAVLCFIVGFLGGDISEFTLDLNVLCSILANVCMGFSAVMYYAYLPLLVDNHVDVVGASDEDRPAAKEMVESRLSAQGIRSGMAGQIIYLIIAAGAFVGGAFRVQDCVTFGAAWVLILGTYAIYNLEQRPGKPLPKGSSYCKESTQKLASTCEKRSKLPQLFVFLLAYFIYSDGTATTASQAGTFAFEVLGADTAVLIGLLVVLSISAIGGTIATIILQEKYGWQPKTFLMCSLCVQGLLPFLALFITELWEMIAVAIVFGMATGPQQSYTRSIYSSLLPKGHEAEFFGLYEITDKGTAWAGPLMVTIVANMSNFRYGYASLIVFYALGTPILFFFKHAMAIGQKKEYEDWEREDNKAKMELVDQS